MKDIELLKGEIREKTLAAKDILDSENVTKEDMTKADEIMDEVRNLQDQVEKQEAIEQRRAELDAQVEKLNKVEERKVQAEQLQTADRRPNIQVIGRSSPYFKNDYQAYEAGMWCAAQLLGDEKAKRWIRTHTPYELRDQSVSVDSALVPTPLSSAIINLRDEFGQFTKLAQRYVMTSNTLDVPKRNRKTTAYWPGEASATTTSDTSWEQVTLTANRLAARVIMSREISEDSVVDLASYITRDIALQMAEEIDDQGFQGSGSPFNGLNTLIEADNTLSSHVTISTVNTLEEVTTTHISTLMSNLPTYARKNAKFICSPEAADLVFGRLKAAGGGHTSQTLNGALGESYLGFPIVVVEKMPYAADLDAQVMFAFGDMSLSSAWGERTALDFVVDPYTLSSNGQIAVQAFQRIAINNHSLGDTHNESPIVALVGSAS